ncbi:MAG: hypothetical protein Kow0037_16770 [Calditrichia bacterium]
MAAKSPKGSIILEILVVLTALLLLSVLIVPNQIWEEEEAVTKTCRENLTSLYEAERFFMKGTGEYTDTLSKVLSYVQADSGLQQRQTLVSLTRSMMQVVDNVLNVSAVHNVSMISKAAYEITGDLLGNRRYFQKYENLLNASQEISREMAQFDSSSAFPNFCKVKLFVDSLVMLRDKVSDYPLQNGVLHASVYVDTINAYYSQLEKEALSQFWKAEYEKILNLTQEIRKTDIVKVSSVADRLKKFIDRINTALNDLNNAPASDMNVLASEAQNLKGLHEKFLSPEFFMLTKRYGLTALSETDSILINFSEKQFTCPDAQQPYLVDRVGNQLIVECPNLLDQFSQEFNRIMEPVRALPFAGQVNQLDTLIEKTKAVMSENRKIIRRDTDVLLAYKELDVEMGALDGVFFYKYTKEYQDFINLLAGEKKLSVLKTAVEEILNPIDTLATRIETGNIRDLEEKINTFYSKLQKLDSLSNSMRLPSRLKRNLVSNAEVFQPAVELVAQIKNSFDPTFGNNLHTAGVELEKSLLNALEGTKERVHVIFTKKHVNHGFIKGGEKSWE